MNNDPSNASGRLALNVCVVFLVIFLALAWRIGESPLSGTEPHRAIPAHSMLQTGDYIVPRLWGEPYLAKPPLQYWVLAISEKITGQANEWVWRLPSAVCAALLAAILCIASSRWFGRRGGIVCGFSFLALIVLWPQDRKADIDSLNTLMAVSTAICLIELNCRALRRRWLWMLIGGIAFGGSLLAKGPAGLPVIIGAMIAPAIVNRDWSLIRKWHSWASLVIGGLIFSVWLFAVYQSVQGGSTAGGWTGKSEIVKLLGNMEPEHLLKAAILPVILAGAAMPLTLAIPIALDKKVTQHFTREINCLIRSLIGAITVAIIVGVLARTINPRYMYIVFPLLCPLVGAISSCWEIGSSEFKFQIAARKILIVFSLVIAIGSAYIAALIWIRYEDHSAWLIASALLAIFAGVWTIRKWLNKEDITAARSTVAALLILMLIFSSMVNHKHTNTSSKLAGIELRRILGETNIVTSGDWVMNGPELFYYAGVDVDFRATGLTASVKFKENTWVVFHQLEWDAYSPKRKAEFDEVITLPTRSRNAVLAHYKGKLALRTSHDLVF